MKKNGFTLVELLAVIVVIGLIVTLAVTNVIPIFRKSKNKGFANDAITLAEAAKLKYKDDKLNSIDDDLFIGNISGKKCYSIEEHLLGQYASNLNTRIQGSVEVCYGNSCDYDTKIWITDGSRYIDGKVISENSSIESIIQTDVSPVNYSSCGIDLQSQNIVYNFENTNAIQSLTIPASGVYKLQVWGGQGGYAGYVDDYYGGYGGYSEGTVVLNQGDVLYIGVGSKGVGSTADATTYTIESVTPFNGATYAGLKKNSSAHGGGGGATHIAKNSNRGILQNYSGNQSEILIVAGGGGGASSHKSSPRWSGNGGSAGGKVGNSGDDMNDKYYQMSYGGTQTAGGSAITNTANTSDTLDPYSGSFGKGGGNTSNSTNSLVASGGAGWYGGSGAFHGAGAGGSGYIGNASLSNKSMYCYNCQEALNLPTDENVFTVSTTGTSRYKNTSGCPNGYSSNPVAKCAKAGAGYARVVHVP